MMMNLVSLAIVDHYRRSDCQVCQQSRARLMVKQYKPVNEIPNLQHWTQRRHFSCQYGHKSSLPADYSSGNIIANDFALLKKTISVFPLTEYVSYDGQSHVRGTETQFLQRVTIQIPQPLVSCWICVCCTNCCCCCYCCCEFTITQHRRPFNGGQRSFSKNVTALTPINEARAVIRCVWADQGQSVMSVSTDYISSLRAFQGHL